MPKTPKKILKTGKLSKEDIAFITKYHDKMEAADIADQLRRSQVQVDKYILENLKVHVEENKVAVKKANPQVEVDRVGTAVQITPSIASVDPIKTKRDDSGWVFRQPK